MNRLMTMLLCFSCFLGSLQLEAKEKPVVGAYFTDWAQYRPKDGKYPPFFPKDIDPTILTDVYFAFAIFGFVTRSVDPVNPHLTGHYLIQPVEWNDQSALYPQMQELKKINPSLKTHLSIGGWSFNDPNDPNQIGTYTYKLFSEMVSKKENRKQFIDSAILYAHKYGFDGIDLDWEYPGDKNRGGQEADFDNFLMLLEELSMACKATTPALELTCATCAVVPNGVPDKYRENTSLYFEWLAECAVFLDKINIMSYDYHGAFDQPKITAANAPLNNDSYPYKDWCIEKSLQDYTLGGVPANKIVLGLPTYGRTYGGVDEVEHSDNTIGKRFTKAGTKGPVTRQAGWLAYFEVMDEIGNGRFGVGFDDITETAFAYDVVQKEWVTFDTPDTNLLKVAKAQEYGLAGAFFWSVDCDDYLNGKYPNIRAVYEYLNEE